MFKCKMVVVGVTKFVMNAIRTENKMLCNEVLLISKRKLFVTFVWLEKKSSNVCDRQSALSIAHWHTESNERA